MKLLLDTHVLLWWLADSPRLRPDARAAIADPENEVYISAASIWEASIKRALGRLEFETDELVAALGSGDLEEMAVRVRHGLAAGELPRHHQDPFDRMLVAQSAAEGLTVVTHDRVFDDYGVPTIAC